MYFTNEFIAIEEPVIDGGRIRKALIVVDLRSPGMSTLLQNALASEDGWAVNEGEGVEIRVTPKAREAAWMGTPEIVMDSDSHTLGGS